MSQVVNKILCWDGQRWFTYQPSVTMIQIASQEINSVLTAYGTNGFSIYPLFNTPSNNITKVVQSKQWDNPSYLMVKHAQRLFGLIQPNDAMEDSFTVSVDTETGSASSTFTNAFVATWYNNVGAAATWYNNGNEAAIWQSTSNGVTSFKGGIDQSGVIMGLTFSTNATDMTLISAMIAGQQYQVTL